MSSELVVFEKQLTPLAPRFEQALAGVMPVDRLIRTALISAEKNPYLLECDRQSFFNSIMTAGVLGLEMDGVTGQAFPIPFKKKIQLVIGYKGYNTLGARAGLTITGEVVREGDDFDYMLGTGAFVKHKPRLGNDGRIIGAWATAAANGRPPIVSVLGIDDLLAIKKKAPGGSKPDSPWNDPPIGFPAMCSKSAKRRLARSTPLNVMQLAARMEEAFEEQGQGAFLTADKNLVIEGETEEVARNETPTAEALSEPRETNAPRDPLSRIKADGLRAAGKGMKELRRWWENLHPDDRRNKTLHDYVDLTLKPEAETADATASKVA